MKKFNKNEIDIAKIVNTYINFISDEYNFDKVERSYFKHITIKMLLVEIYTALENNKNKK